MPLLTTGGGTYPVIGGGGGLGLQTNLGSFWALDTLNDSTGNVSALTNNASVTVGGTPPGTPPSAIATCSNFVYASSQYLSHADATGLNIAGIDFSMQAWVYTANASGTIASKSTGSFSSREFEWTRNFATGSSDPFRFSANPGVNTTLDTTNNTPSVWRHLVITLNATTKALIAYVDGVNVASSTIANNPAGASQFNIGANASPGTFWNGSVALLGIWRNRVLSAGDVTALYNSGNGRTYAQML